MLYLIGVGLYDEKDITIRGVEAARACQELYLELYTSRWVGRKGLEELVGRPIEEIGRRELEEGAGKIIESARLKDVGVFVPGDPLVATTHVALVLEASKRGVDYRVVHAPSVYSAVAATGLSIYKFGKTCTIPRIQKGYDPTSFYDTVVENLRVGAHTLCLLDVDPPMTVSEAAARFEEVDKQKGGGVLRGGRMAVAASFGESTTMIYARIDELKKMEFPTPAVLIVPAQLANIEAEAMETVRVGD